MRQIVRVLFAIAALSLLTLYFFCDLVLIEPVVSQNGSGESGASETALLAQSPSSPERAMKSAHELNRDPGVPGTAIFRGIKGISGGAVSTFKATWHQLYLRWPIGKGSSHHPGRPLSVRWSNELHERVGALLTLVCLALAVAAFSLVITWVEEKARA